MKIVVCMKQVPLGTNVEIDQETGSMKRLSGATRTNPYDLFALEAALRLREEKGGTVTVLSMGPEQATSMMKDAYFCGADDAVILSDKKFAGADVLATSYTLSQGIKMLGGADIIICGKQTTDGDTAQVGPALAEHLGIPHAAWVAEIMEITDGDVTVRQDFGSMTQISKLTLPCLISVDANTNVPRLPSYKIKQQYKDKPVKIVSYDDLPSSNLSLFGLVGSPTSVERMFAPEAMERQVHIEGNSPEDKAEGLFDTLKKIKVI